jgi:probable HAF family extracellular repeat protein
MRRSTRRRAGIGFTAAVVVLGAAACTSDLGTLPGDPSGAATGVNDAGVIVGATGPQGSLIHAFRIDPGHPMTALPPLTGYTGSVARAVDAGGDVVGWACQTNDGGCSEDEGGGDARAVRWSPSGQATDLGTLGGNYSHAEAISTGGVVVGESTTASGTDLPFAYDPTVGSMHALAVPAGAISGEARGIDDGGDVVGQVTLADQSIKPIRWHLGSATYELLGSTGYGAAYAINATGTAVGWAHVAGDANTHAVEWPAGSTTPVDRGSFGGTLTMLLAVTPDGTAVGLAIPSGGGGFHAILSNPGTSASVDLGGLGGTGSTAAIAINASHEIVGYSYDTNNHTRPTSF